MRSERAVPIVWAATRAMTLRRPGGGQLKLAAEVLEGIREYVQNEPEKLEAGGVLLGRYIRGTSDVVVDRVTVPSRGDLQNRLRFFRARKTHQEQIDAVWAASHGTTVYLGEWHTHPVPAAVPSWIDVLDWRRKLFVDHFATYLFFLVAGTTEIGVWEGRRYRLRLQLLQQEQG